MLHEEMNSFSKSHEEIGCITSVETNINLFDETPVQQNYNSVPRPLYPEIKAYTEDLLNRDWIVKSNSLFVRDWTRNNTVLQWILGIL